MYIDLYIWYGEHTRGETKPRVHHRVVDTCQRTRAGHVAVTWPSRAQPLPERMAGVWRLAYGLRAFPPLVVLNTRHRDCLYHSIGSYLTVASCVCASAIVRPSAFPGPAAPCTTRPSGQSQTNRGRVRLEWLWTSLDLRRKKREDAGRRGKKREPNSRRRDVDTLSGCQSTFQSVRGVRVVFAWCSRGVRVVFAW